MWEFLKLIEAAKNGTLGGLCVPKGIAEAELLDLRFLGYDVKDNGLFWVFVKTAK